MPINSALCSPRLLMNSFLGLGLKKQMPKTVARFLLSPCMMQSGHKSDYSAIYSRCVITCLLPIFDVPLTGHSMRTMPNRHSRRHRYQRCKTPSQHLRSCMPHGRRLLPSLVTNHSFQHSLLEWKNSTRITSEVLSLTRTLWP